MLDYDALRAVAAIVQTGSFERAARQLGVTPSAVSQRIKQLEERLGTVLIVRGQPCVATEQGDWLCRHMELVGKLEGELFAHMPGLARHGDSQPVTLHVATNADSLGTWFLAGIASYARQSGHMGEQFALQHADALHMAAQPVALLRRDARLAARDQHGPQPLLQLLHALRDGRGRHPELARRPLEAAGLHNRRDGAERVIVQH